MKSLKSINIILLLAGLMMASFSLADNNDTFKAQLSGEQEVPPVTTIAHGVFMMKQGNRNLNYRLAVANIEDVVAAHIHCAAPGENGPVGVTLFSGSETTITGILAHGPILAVNSDNGCEWNDIEDLINAAEEGNTYVNVHTVLTPSGEMRGQID